MGELPVPTMTKRRMKRLLKLLAELHEKAYRRGFQHGHLAGLGLHSFGPTPTERQVAEWRGRGYGDTEPPPHGGHHKRKKPHAGDSVIGRMTCEATGDIARWLRDVEQACAADKKETGGEG